MRDTIYLVADRGGIRRMTKTLQSISRGEAPIRLSVTIDEKAFGAPVISQEIIIDDWRQGIDLGDVEFKQNIITAEEAETIRANRMAKMSEMLEAQGFTVIPPVKDGDAN